MTDMGLQSDYQCMTSMYDVPLLSSEPAGFKSTVFSSLSNLAQWIPSFFLILISICTNKYLILIKDMKRDCWYETRYTGKPRYIEKKVSPTIAMIIYQLLLSTRA